MMDEDRSHTDGAAGDDTVESETTVTRCSGCSRVLYDDERSYAIVRLDQNGSDAEGGASGHPQVDEAPADAGPTCKAAGRKTLQQNEVDTARLCPECRKAFDATTRMLGLGSRIAAPEVT